MGRRARRTGPGRRRSPARARAAARRAGGPSPRWRPARRSADRAAWRGGAGASPGRGRPRRGGRRRRGGAAGRRRRCAGLRGGWSRAVGLAVFGGGAGGDVPAAVATARGLVVAAVAVERAAEEELFEPAAVLVAQLGRVERQGHVVAARVAVAVAE